MFLVLFPVAVVLLLRLFLVFFAPTLSVTVVLSGGKVFSLFLLFVFLPDYFCAFMAEFCAVIRLRCSLRQAMERVERPGESQWRWTEKKFLLFAFFRVGDFNVFFRLRLHGFRRVV